MEGPDFHPQEIREGKKNAKFSFSPNPKKKEVFIRLWHGEKRELEGCLEMVSLTFTALKQPTITLDNIECNKG